MNKCSSCAKGTLEWDEKRECYFCPVCYPKRATPPKPTEPLPAPSELTEGRVREIVQEELEKYTEADVESVKIESIVEDGG